MKLTLEQLEQVRNKVNQKLKDLSIPVTINMPFLIMLEILQQELSLANQSPPEIVGDQVGPGPHSAPVDYGLHVKK